MMKRALVLAMSFFMLSFCSSEKPAELPQDDHAIVVEEVIQVDNYTYLFGKNAQKSFWLAGPHIDAQKGKTYYFGESMEMANFHSKELNRTFDSILFVSSLSESPQPSASNMQTGKDVTMPPEKSDQNIAAVPLAGEVTVEQVYNQKEQLSGKKIRIRGKVVKVNNAIMNRNWIHIHDGTGKSGSDDLLITSSQTANKGDQIVAEGIVVVDKDFGAGYSYAVLLENAQITVEK